MGAAGSGVIAARVSAVGSCNIRDDNQRPNAMLGTSSPRWARAAIPIGGMMETIEVTVMIVSASALLDVEVAHVPQNRKR